MQRQSTLTMITVAERTMARRFDAAPVVALLALTLLAWVSREPMLLSLVIR